MELVFQSSINLTIILPLTLTSMYHSLQYMSVKSGVTVLRNYGNVETIKKGISYFNWSKAFENLSSDEKVEYHNEALLNIFRNYSPNKKIECDYCQPPWILTHWINKNIKSFLKPRSKLTKTFYKSGLRKNDHINVLEESTEKKVLEAKKLCS